MMETIDGKAFSPEVPERLLRISQEIQTAGGRSYLVGGFVRDALLGRTCRDYDVEVYDITEDALLGILRRYGRPNLVGKAFGVIHLASRGLDLDFSFPRTENKIGQGHRGFLVQTHLNLSFAEAALRRDFTINAMGMELPALTLCDPYHGRDDLRSGILRHVSPAFSEDSLRILRGVQFASRFRLRLAPETVALCRSLSLEDLSCERIYEEFKKWLLKPGEPSLGLKAFCEMDLARFFPEIRGLDGDFNALGTFLDTISERLPDVPEARRPVLAFAVLLSGAESKTEVAGVLSRMTNEITLLRDVPVLWEKAPELLSHFRKNGGAFDATFLRRLSVPLKGLSLATEFCRALPGTPEKFRMEFYDALRKISEDSAIWNAAPEAYLTGKALLELGLKPGKRMGELIRMSFELQLDGKITNEKDAVTWAASQIKN